VYVVIVTGSRAWPVDQSHLVFAELDALRNAHPVLHIKVGDCPTGVDVMTRSWYLAQKWRRGFITCDIYRADWKHYGRQAGPMRNICMCHDGADLCLSFPLGESRGTRNCVKWAHEYDVKDFKQVTLESTSNQMRRSDD
jgi:YspA, cpYpsA-related SLOG family